MKYSGDYRPWNLGSFAGHSSSDVTPQLKPFMNEKSGQKVDGGESFDDFKNRFIPAFEALMEQVEKGHVIGLVTHSRNVELIQGWLGGKGPRQKIDTSAITADSLDPATVIKVTKGRGRWRLQQIEDETRKEGAPGPAGDIPSGADWGLGQYGSGPSLDDVHVNRPLLDISTNYATTGVPRKRKLRVMKADQYKQMIYGVVLEPNVLDSQDDFMYPDQVEQAAHTYMKRVARGKASVSKLQHLARGFYKEKPSVVPVESFIAPCDFSYDGKEMVRKGTWVMGLHIEDPGVWKDVLAGKYTGLSIGGTGVRHAMSTPSDIPPEVVPHQWMTGPPDWASGAGVFAKTAEPKDFASWRDHSWEGS